MKMWKKMFGGKNDEVAKEKNKTAEETVKTQDAPRIEPLQGTEAEIEKKAEDGMKAMGFAPVEETKSNKFKSRIRGNDYCPCKSSKKFKKCCALDAKEVEKFQKTMDIKI